MAETNNRASNALSGPVASEGNTPAPPPRDAKPKKAPLNEIYVRPAPIKTFPLPVFIPNNPLSLLHLAWAWTKQVFFPPPAEPSMIWEGVWSPETRSVHITDPQAIRAFWEQGFYGKGNLSRSEPNWLKREKVRKGLEKAHVSEEHTVSRREERIKMKWERARAEQEAIRQTREEEARMATAARSAARSLAAVVLPPPALSRAAPIGPAELLALPNSLAELALAPAPPLAQGPITIDTALEVDGKIVNGTPTNGSANPSNPAERPSSSSASDTSDEQKTLKRRKSVRFSPKVESTTFDHSDPPSPGHAQANGGPLNGQSKRPTTPPTNGAAASPQRAAPVDTTAEAPVSIDDIVDKEHLQLTVEEAFFLAFGMGVLKVREPSGKGHLDTASLFTALRQHSYFPPRAESKLEPDDPFLVHYAVYHHFRSLGWVPRPGIKFAMDWMLYARGPVFDHAEFGVIVMPSYTHEWWKQNDPRVFQKSWHWLHGVVRVLSQVMKSLVLVYVEVPPPHLLEEACEKGPAEVFKLYSVREVMVKRWSGNRNR
ncbi:tRNA-splicing endonuclease subunit Sen2 [Plectosphaerella cucumerina]|uniref:tRNA-intron lyase n=1 Tax=Plectosphaerella cucumerina TaxID=40658 RepID=A0A8K0TNG9_9PEZI|nr:tRNA-splicing endonuclease subunit Sen2 [Plectosphaerella cucumerina]